MDIGRASSPAPDGPADTVPYRLVSRLSNELHASALVSLGRLIPGQYDERVTLLVLLRACLPDWIADGGVRRPARLTRFGSTKALARSLGRPVQTIRRHVQTLVRHGICVGDERGIAVSNDPGASARIVAYCHEAHDILLRMIGGLDEAIGLARDRAAATPPPRAAIVATALDIYLVPFEMMRDQVGDWTSMMLWSMIGTANTRAIMLDPVLSRRYAVQRTPDALRAPVSLQSVAAVVDVPYATAWRHARRLIAAGRVARTPRGLVLTSEELRVPAVEAMVRALVDYYLRRIRALVAAGIDLDRLDAAYIDGRPPLVDFPSGGRSTPGACGTRR